MKRDLAAALMSACMVAHAHSEELTGQLARVIDGDSFVLAVPRAASAGPKEVTIHVIGIDAPESDQPWHDESKSHLQQLLEAKIIKVRSNGMASAMTSGQVLTDGQDVGLEQLRSGMAWYARSNSAPLTLQDQGYYLSAEAAARDKKEGLWAAKHPTAPWVFRAMHKRGRK